MKVAEYGPIVVVNATRFRSDAIIVTTSAIKALALPRLLYEEAKDKMRGMAQLFRGKRATYVIRNEVMHEILLWLWDVVVEPVVWELKLNTMTSDSELTRVWWIGVGMLSMAPFHAAGDSSPGSTRNTLSHIVSSYIPTIQALSYARQRKFDLVTKPDPRLLIVAMPTTPYCRPLLTVEKEVGAIVDSFGKRGSQASVLRQPNASKVLEQLWSYDAVHFACRSNKGPFGCRNSDDSLTLLNKSYKDGSETIDKLTVQDILNTNIRNGQLAYLSACSSHDSLACESISLVSAFQLAGFNHVLSNLWLSGDHSRAQVARYFYSTLFGDQGSGSGEENRKVAIAMHEAVKKLRNTNRRVPIIWASFIHTGA